MPKTFSIKSSAFSLQVYYDNKDTKLKEGKYDRLDLSLDTILNKLDKYLLSQFASDEFKNQTHVKITFYFKHIPPKFTVIEGQERIAKRV